MLIFLKTKSFHLQWESGYPIKLFVMYCCKNYTSQRAPFLSISCPQIIMIHSYLTAVIYLHLQQRMKTNDNFN